MTDARLLGGRYELSTPLGYGGMAEVHMGRDTRLGRDVAVKVLRSDLARDTSFQTRFRREAQNSASLNHPSIVAVYDTGEDLLGDATLPYIVMEFVEGRTLKDVLIAEGRLLPRRAMEITADVCAALDFSHRNGIIHRDIKPANVMLTPTGAVKVMDFGIARAIASSTATMTATSAVIGTAQYLSPEQARGETVDARSDVYSTGCLLYELLCGEPPFTGDNPVSVAYQHVREDPIPPSERNPDVTPDIDAVVLKSMAKNPANRYQSAGEMRDDLLRAAAGQPVSATPVLSSDERTQIIGAAAPTRFAGDGGGTTQITKPAQDNRGKKILAWTLVVVGVLAIFGLAAWGTSQFLGNQTPQVTVPNVVGKPLADATAELEQKKFQVKHTTRESSVADKGKVLEQSPEANKEAAQNSVVNLTVGGGPEMTKVPNLDKTMNVDAARALLAQNELQADVRNRPSAEPEGQLLEWSPVNGTSVAVNSKVILYVSDNSLRLVPQVVDLTQSDAESRLERANLKVKVVREPSSKTSGTVIGQSPEQGDSVKIGTTVTITVAAPLPSPTPTNSPSPTPSPSGSGSPSPSNSPPFSFPFSPTPRTTPSDDT